MRIRPYGARESFMFLPNLYMFKRSKILRKQRKKHFFLKGSSQGSYLTSLLPGKERIPLGRTLFSEEKDGTEEDLEEVGQTLQECVHTAWKRRSSFKG